MNTLTIVCVAFVLIFAVFSVATALHRYFSSAEDDAPGLPGSFVYERTSAELFDPNDVDTTTPTFEWPR